MEIKLNNKAAGIAHDQIHALSAKQGFRAPEVERDHPVQAYVHTSKWGRLPCA
jgi:hypothetical protein